MERGTFLSSRSPDSKAKEAIVMQLTASRAAKVIGVVMLSLILIVPALVAAAAGGGEDQKGQEKAERPWLGFGFTWREAPDGKVFLHVERVATGGPAEEAGLQPFDVITKIAGRELNFENEQELLEYLIGFQPGDEVRLVVVRAREELTISLIAGGMSEDQAARWERAYEHAKREAQRKSSERQ
jgi:S1-C subfamily serine protease